VITAVDAFEHPSALLDEADKIFAGNLFHSIKPEQIKPEHLPFKASAPTDSPPKI
jgi:hypothetical protein